MQNLVVVLRDALYQLRVKRFCLLLQVFGNLFRLVFRAHGLVRPHDRLHIDQIDDSDELIFLADGNLDRDGLGAEALADGIDGVLEISTHLVDLVDKADSGHAVFIGLAPDFFRLRLHAVDRVKHRHRAVQHAQRSLDFRGEIHVAGSINNVDPDVAPGAGRGRGRDRDAALLLLRHPVHRRGAFMDLTNAVRASCVEQDALRRGGLAGIDVGHDADVSATL